MTVNQNKFNGCDPGTLICLIKSSLQYEGAYRFWDETIEMLYDENGWDPKPANAGLKQLVYVPPFNLDTVKIVACLDSNLQPATTPQPLYDGTDMTGDDPDLTKRRGVMVPIADRPAGCKFLTVENFKKTDFAKIGVPEFPS